MDLSDRVWTESRAIMRRTLILPETAFVYTFQYQSVDLGAGVSTTDKAKRYLGEGSQYGAEQLVHVVLQEGEKSENVLTVGGIGEHLIRQYFAISLGPGLVQGSSVNPSTYPTETQTVNPTYFTNRAGFYVNDEHTFGRQRASAGVRMDLDSLFGLTVNPRAGLVLSPVEKLHLKALYGEAYKAPTIFELYDEWRGNLELTPEKIRTVELIAELFPLEDAHLSVGAFHSNADNLILVAPNRNPDQVPIGPEGQRADYYQNRGDVQWMGMTVLVDAVAADILRASANYSMTVGSALQPLDNVSTHKVNAALNLDVLDRADVNLRMNWASRVKAPETNLYWQPRDRAFEDENYPYVRARGADGFGPGHFLTHLVVTGRDLFPGDHQLRPQLAILNLFDARWLAMGRQAGSGVKPQDPSSVSNPAGFSPPYHPQPGREIWFQIQYEY